MTIGADTIRQLRQAHRGDIILPGDVHYESGRRVWNAMIDRRPAVIARPRSAADVIAAVNFARDAASADRGPRRRAQRRRTRRRATTAW